MLENENISYYTSFPFRVDVEFPPPEYIIR